MRDVAVASLLVALSACDITDTGNPPMAPVIDPTLVDGAVPLGDPVLVTGAGGAIQPAAGIVRLTNLEDGSDPVDAPVAPDGSFEANIVAMDGDVVRVQAIAGERRSGPLDLEVGPFVAIVPALDCLVLDPSSTLVLAPASTGAIEIANECASDVMLASSVRRTAGISITLEAAQVAAGATVAAVVETDASASGEEVIFVAADSPAADRRPITVVVR
jgi:hypothetical protein